MHRVIFESGCKNLVIALNNRSLELAIIGVLLKEARSLCIGSFESSTFQLASCSCNVFSHSLAQYGLHVEIACTGSEDVAPDFIFDLVASDIAEPV